MNITTLLEQVRAGSLAFSDVLAAIDAQYQHHPTAFTNGATRNEATQNQGSARVFAFAMLNHLSTHSHSLQNTTAPSWIIPKRPTTRISVNSWPTAGTESFLMARP